MIIFGVFFARIFIKIVYTEKWATDVSLINITNDVVCLRHNESILHIHHVYGLERSSRSLYLRQGKQSNFKKIANLPFCDICVSRILYYHFSLYVAASLFLSGPFGIPGLIYANCLNMSIRIVTSIYYAIKMEKDSKIVF